MSDRRWLQITTQCQRCGRKTSVDLLPLLASDALEFWEFLCDRCSAQLNLDDMRVRAHLTALKSARADLFERLRTAFPATHLWNRV